MCKTFVHHCTEACSWLAVPAKVPGREPIQVMGILRPTTGGSVKPVTTSLTNLVPLEQFHQKPTGVYGGGLHHTFQIVHSQRFVMELLHWHKVCELGGDKLHRPPVVALNKEFD